MKDSISLELSLSVFLLLIYYEIGGRAREGQASYCPLELKNLLQKSRTRKEQDPLNEIAL